LKRAAAARAIEIQRRQRHRQEDHPEQQAPRRGGQHLARGNRDCRVVAVDDPRIGLLSGEAAGEEVASEQRGDGGEHQQQQRVEHRSTESHRYHDCQRSQDYQHGCALYAVNALRARSDFVKKDLESAHRGGYNLETGFRSAFRRAL
jgi:hypothetical protein